MTYILISTVPNVDQRYEVLHEVLWVSFLFLAGALTFTKNVFFLYHALQLRR